MGQAAGAPLFCVKSVKYHPLNPCVRPGRAAEANHGPAAEDRDVHGGSLPGLGRHLHELGRLHQASVPVSQNQGQRYVNHKKNL
jgi:hypothetical protein